MQPSIVPNSLPNDQPLFANTIAGKIKITHHTNVNLFGIPNLKINFFLLPSLKSFHGILGNDSLKQLSAVIYTKYNYMTIQDRVRIKIKQQTIQSINTIDIRTDLLNDGQKRTLIAIARKFPKLLAEPEERLTYTTKVQGSIRTSTDTPIYTKFYPYPMALKAEVEKQIKDLL